MFVCDLNCLLSVSLSTCLPAGEGLKRKESDWTEVIELTEPWGWAIPGGVVDLKNAWGCVGGGVVPQVPQVW